MKPPCTRECPDRSPTCHCTCERWQVYEDWKKAEYARREIEYRAAPFTIQLERAVRMSMKHEIRRPGKSGKH